MLKKTAKLAGLLILLVLSFVYTDQVFSTARKSDPVMKQVARYKEKNDELPTEPKITDDEMILGSSGLVVNTKESYNNMKRDDKFNEEKIVYESKAPKTTISKTYDYYVKQGNPSKPQVAIVFKLDENSDNPETLLRMVAKYNVPVNFFVDGAWLDANIENAFSMVNLGCELYNLGYQGSYDKKMIGVTNNLIESISLKDSKYCLNENKDDEAKNVCGKRKMITLAPTMVDPSVSDIKESLVKGGIISYSADDFDPSTFGIVIKTITSRGYDIKELSKVMTE